VGEQRGWEGGDSLLPPVQDALRTGDGQAGCLAPERLGCDMSDFPLCHYCKKKIWNSRTCVEVRGHLYYEELCAVEKIDFIPFEKLGLDINLSTTAKKYKEQCLAYIEKVVDDINLIKATEFEVEAMAEYKVGLNVSRAITVIRDRKIREKIEADKLEKFMAQQLEQQRLKDIEKEAKKVEVLQAPEAVVPTEQTPIVEQPSNIVDIIVAQFECTGTREQLKSVGQFMRENNINYRNI